jgi:hypothetical protein
MLIFNTCHNLIKTLPALIHDENHPEDVDTDAEDHAPDTARYVTQTLRARKVREPLHPVAKKMKEAQGKERFLNNISSYYSNE